MDKIIYDEAHIVHGILSAPTSAYWNIFSGSSLAAACDARSPSRYSGSMDA